MIKFYDPETFEYKKRHERRFIRLPVNMHETKPYFCIRIKDHNGKMHDIKVKQISLSELYDQLQSKPGKKITIIFKRDNKVFTTSFKLKKYIWKRMLFLLFCLL